MKNYNRFMGGVDLLMLRERLIHVPAVQEKGGLGYSILSLICVWSMLTFYIMKLNI